jgi:hypothetical protein
LVSDDLRLLATSVTNSAQIPVDQLGAAGAPAWITIQALFGGGAPKGDGLRDTSMREFIVEAQLTRRASSGDGFNAAFTGADGGSFVKVPPTTTKLKVQSSHGDFEVETNASHELSLVRMAVQAQMPVDAIFKANDAIAAFLDQLSFHAQAPVSVALVKARDPKNEITTFGVVGPERENTINTGGQELHVELAPIYALYREFKNSESAYYRLLCLYKIMEGILGVLRRQARDRAKELSVPLGLPKERVPEHPDIPSHLRYLIGKPIRDFYDNTLQKGYRDVAAHFLVQDTVVLHVSSSVERSRFAEMTFICDLCVRILITNHEALLTRLQAFAAAHSAT